MQRLTWHVNTSGSGDVGHGGPDIAMLLREKLLAA